MTTKIPAELSSTPSIVDNGDATAITIDSSENIGIGTTSPASNQGFAKTVEISDAGATTGPDLMLTNPTAGTDEFLGLLSFNHANDALAAISAKTDGATDSGHIQFLTQATGGAITERMRILSGGGLTFNGDTAAANALDDYEEGTWTPTIIGSSGTSGQSYTLQLGSYTRIGRFVHMTFDVRLSAKGTISGYAFLGGHGFTFVGNNVGGSLFTAYVANLNNQDHYPVTGYATGTSIYLMNPPTDYLVAGDFTDTTILLGSIVGQIA